MQELVGGKNTIGQMAAVLKKPHKATFLVSIYFAGVTTRMSVIYSWVSVIGNIKL